MVWIDIVDIGGGAKCKSYDAFTLFQYVAREKFDSGHGRKRRFADGKTLDHTPRRCLYYDADRLCRVQQRAEQGETSETGSPPPENGNHS
jgi:hypothetical protein